MANDDNVSHCILLTTQLPDRQKFQHNESITCFITRDLYIQIVKIYNNLFIYIYIKILVYMDYSLNFICNKLEGKCSWLLFLLHTQHFFPYTLFLLRSIFRLHICTYTKGAWWHKRRLGNPTNCIRKRSFCRAPLRVVPGEPQPWVQRWYFLWVKGRGSHLTEWGAVTS